jgi:uncharacterized membrane protein
MESAFIAIAENIALVAEIIGALLIAIGVLDATVRLVLLMAARRVGMRTIKDIWLRLAGWILLSLEFQLGADIVRTSISPTWEDLGKLAAIAAIRTVLSIFLERDLDAFEKEQPARSRPDQPQPAD